MAFDFVRASSNQLVTASGTSDPLPLTIAAWFNSDDSSNSQYVAGVAGASGTDARGHYLNLGGNTLGDVIRAVSIANGGANSIATTLTGYTVGTWHHGCAVFAATDDRRAFIDGGGKGTQTTSRAPTLDRYSIGADNAGGNAMNGRIAEVAIWNVALEDAEVALLAKGLSPLLMRPNALVHLWQMVDVLNRDIIGGLTGTVTGTPTVAAHPRIIYPRARLIVPASGGTGVNLSLSKTLDNYTLSGALTSPHVFDLSKTLDSVTVSATLAVLIQATLSKTLDSVTLSSALAAIVDLTLSKTLDNVTLSATASVANPGVGLDLSKTLDAVTVSSTLAVLVQTTLSQTLDSITLSSDLDVLVQLTLSKTLDSGTLSSTVGQTVNLDLAKTLDAVTASSTLAILVQTSLAKTPDSVTASSTLAVLVQATLSKTLDSVTLSSDLDVLVGLSLTKTLDSVTLSSTASVISGVVLNLEKTLDDVTGAGTLSSLVQLALTSTLGSVTLAAELDTGAPDTPRGGWIKAAGRWKDEDIEREDLEIIAMLTGNPLISELME